MTNHAQLLSGAFRALDDYTNKDQRKRSCTIEYAMNAYNEGFAILMKNQSGSQVFNKLYGNQTLLNFTIGEIADSEWYVIIE